MNRQRRPRPLRLPVLAASAALAVITVAACSSAASSGSAAGSAAGSASSGPITIGMSLPMTGPVADVSKSGYQGYELWASQVNAAGGEDGEPERAGTSLSVHGDCLLTG